MRTAHSAIISYVHWNPGWLDRSNHLNFKPKYRIPINQQWEKSSLDEDTL